MHTIILASPHVDHWNAFADALESDGRFRTHRIQSGGEAVEAAKEKNPLAIVIDQDLDDMSAIELVAKLLTINAMINVAMVSDQPVEDFHEATEGLGILMQLAPFPTAAEAGRLAECLSQLTGTL